MNEPTNVCPSCKTEIKLTEPLAAPLIESTHRQYEQQIAQKDADIRKREAAVKEQQAAFAEAQESIDDQVAAKLKDERAITHRWGSDASPWSGRPRTPAPPD